MEDVPLEDVPLEDIKDYEIVEQLAYIWFDVRFQNDVVVDQLEEVISRLKDEMIHTYVSLRAIPTEWYQKIITTHIDIYLPPKEWLVAWKLSGFQKPAIQYGICTKSHIDNVLLRHFSWRQGNPPSYI